MAFEVEEAVEHCSLVAVEAVYLEEEEEENYRCLNPDCEKSNTSF